MEGLEARPEKVAEQGSDIVKAVSGIFVHAQNSH